MSVLIRWFPHSWFQVKAGGKVIYIDQAYLKGNFADYPGRIEFSSWPDPIDGLPEKLKKADIILVTHHHKDHCKRVTLERLRRRDTLVVAPGRCVKELGDDIRVVQPGEEIARKGVTIKAVEAYNAEGGSSTRKIHHKGDGVGYLVTVGGKTIYHAGDTDLIPGMEELGDVDVAMLPIGGKFTMDVQEAVRAVVVIDPGVVIPMHLYGEDPLEFKSGVEAVSSIKVVPLPTGTPLNCRAVDG